MIDLYRLLARSVVFRIETDQSHDEARDVTPSVCSVSTRQRFLALCVPDAKRLFDGRLNFFG